MTPVEAFRVYEDAVLRFLRGWNPESEDYDRLSEASRVLSEVVKYPDLVNRKLKHYEAMMDIMKKLP